MPFPLTPTDGEKANVNGVTYTYNSTLTAWTVTSDFLDTFTGNALIANSATIVDELNSATIVTGNILTDGYYYANGDPFAGGGTAITNGDSNVNIATANADITMSVDGVGNVVVVTASGITVQGNVSPSANLTYDLGNSTNRWNELYLAGNSIYLGNIIMKNTEGNTVEFFDADGTTPAAISSQNIQVDAASIANGNSSMSISGENGNIVANVAGSVVATFVSGGISTNRNITANTTIGNVNAMAVGPVIIADGVTVTISSGGEWSIA